MAHLSSCSRAVMLALVLIAGAATTAAVNERLAAKVFPFFAATLEK